VVPGHKTIDIVALSLLSLRNVIIEKILTHRSCSFMFRLQCQKCPVSVFETKNLLCASAGSAAAWLPPNIGFATA